MWAAHRWLRARPLLNGPAMACDVRTPPLTQSLDLSTAQPLNASGYALTLPGMGYCRVDTDLLRGLASQLGAAAVVVEDAGPAVALLETHGFGPEATLVAARRNVTTEWLQQWEQSLLTRADLVDAERNFFTSATVATPPMIQTAADRSMLAGLVSDPAQLTSVLAEPSPLERRFVANRYRIEAARNTAQASFANAAGWNRIGHLHALAMLDRLAAPGRMFLAFDWERGRIVEWVGPTTAFHVAVYVPGAGVSKLDFARMAERVGAMVEHDPTSGDLAVIVALAYDTPPTLAHAALGRYADAGGPQLIDLLGGLDLNGRHVTLIGHSYGSVVVGEALRNGLLAHLPADYDVVALGSPGMRADDVDDLGVDANRVWAARLPGDPIGYAVHLSEVPRLLACAATGLSAQLESCRPGSHLTHGTDPTDASFGGQVFGATAPHAGIDAHTDYLAAELDGATVVPSLVLRELIRIAVGRAPGDE